MPVHSLTPRIIRDKLRERASNRLPVANDFRGTWPACHWFTGPLSNTDGVRATACFPKILINLFSNFQPIAIVHKLEKIKQKKGEEFDSSSRKICIINYAMQIISPQQWYFFHYSIWIIVHVPVLVSYLYSKTNTKRSSTVCFMHICTCRIF